MNTVAGRIVSMESGRGVADVTVTALAEGVENEYGLAHRRLGSTLTDQDGRFRIDYEPPDAAPDWELVTLATAGRDCENDTVLARCPRRGPAPAESVMLRIPDAALVDAELAVPGAAPQAAGIIADEAGARAYATALAADRRRLLALGLSSARAARKQTEKKFDRFITGLSDAAGGRGERRYAPKDTPVSEAVLTAVRDGLTNSIHQLGLDNHRVFTASEIASLRAQFPDLKNVDAAAVDQISPAGKKVLPIGLQWFDPLWACRRQTPINDCVALLDPNHPQPQDNPADGPAADQPADEPSTGDPAPQ
ncbi:carboxypeptidase-like regulatory domain-containing protein, partial [Nocardia vulneris]